MRSAFRVSIALGTSFLLAWPAAAQQPLPLPVEVVAARALPVERTLESTGEVVARDAVDLAFQTGGRVLDVAVDEGERVEVGQILARVEPVQQEQTLRAAKAGLATAEADSRQAADDLARQDALLTDGITTRAARDAAEATARATAALVEQAQSDVDSAEKSLADTMLTAPFAGLVIARNVEPGQVVAAAQTVLELATDSGFDAVFDIPESALAREDSGPPPVTLSLIDGDPAPLTGHVTKVSPQIDAASGTVEVTVAIDAAPAGLTDGASIRGSVAIMEDPRITLPNWALTGEGEGMAVWLVDPATQTVSLRPVRVLRHVTGAVILADGLAEGDMVVARGAHLMYPGRLVTAVEVK